MNETILAVGAGGQIRSVLKAPTSTIIPRRTGLRGYFEELEKHS